jgi:hypothetical protein
MAAGVPRPGPVSPIPTDVRASLREADRRIRRHSRRYRNSAFVPCHFGGAYGLLQHLAAQAEAAGTLFCDGGSASTWLHAWLRDGNSTPRASRWTAHSCPRLGV